MADVCPVAATGQTPAGGKAVAAADASLCAGVLELRRRVEAATWDVAAQEEELLVWEARLQRIQDVNRLKARLAAESTERSSSCRRRAAALDGITEGSEDSSQASPGSDKRRELAKAPTVDLAEETAAVVALARAVAQEAKALAAARARLRPRAAAPPALPAARAPSTPGGAAQPVAMGAARWTLGRVRAASRPSTPERFRGRATLMPGPSGPRVARRVGGCQLRVRSVAAEEAKRGASTPLPPPPRPPQTPTQPLVRMASCGPEASVPHGVITWGPPSGVARPPSALRSPPPLMLRQGRTGSRGSLPLCRSPDGRPGGFPMADCRAACALSPPRLQRPPAALPPSPAGSGHRLLQRQLMVTPTPSRVAPAWPCQARGQVIYAPQAVALSHPGSPPAQLFSGAPVAWRPSS